MNSINNKKVLSFLKECTDAERIYVGTLLDMAKGIRDTITRFSISEKEFCEAMCIKKNRYQDYLNAAVNYSIQDIARLEALRFTKLNEQKIEEARKEAEMLSFPDYKWNQPTESEKL